MRDLLRYHSRQQQGELRDARETPRLQPNLWVGIFRGPRYLQSAGSGLTTVAVGFDLQGLDAKDALADPDRRKKRRYSSNSTGRVTKLMTFAKIHTTLAIRAIASVPRNT